MLNDDNDNVEFDESIPNLDIDEEDEYDKKYKLDE